jgi:hypothetical protein
MTSPDHARPITDGMPMGGHMIIARAGDRHVSRIVAVGDASCPTDPALAQGLSFALAHRIR